MIFIGIALGFASDFLTIPCFLEVDADDFLEEDMEECATGRGGDFFFKGLSVAFFSDFCFILPDFFVFFDEVAVPFRERMVVDIEMRREKRQPFRCLPPLVLPLVSYTRAQRESKNVPMIFFRNYSFPASKRRVFSRCSSSRSPRSCAIRIARSISRISSRRSSLDNRAHI